MRGITRYVEDLIRSRRPRRFRASEEEASLVRAAITLRAARPGGAARDEFVTALHKRLAAELDPPSPTPAASRRRTFLRVAAITTSAAAAGAAIDHEVTSRTQSEAPATATTLTPSHGTWSTVAVSADLPDGTVRPFTAGSVTGFIERSGGRLRAVSGICTHQGCRLNLSSATARLLCPCHGATFALDGTVLTHPSPIPLTPLPHLEVRETDGEIQVYAPTSLLGERHTDLPLRRNHRPF